MAAPEWADDSPLTDHLNAIDDASLLAAQACDEALISALTRVLPTQCEAIKQLCELPAPDLTRRSPGNGLSKEPSHVPGRKWAQICAFCDALPAPEHPLLDWCSGKAHLGREIHTRHGQPVTALEIDPILVEAGNTLSGNDPIHIHRCDVLSPEARHFLDTNQQIVALHACGELHRKLLRDAVAVGCEQISWSPCCYHKFLPGEYSPLSQLGQAQGLNLTSAEIRGAVRQNSTAGHAEKQRFVEHQSWRLGFDALQRSVRGKDTYLHTPPLNRLNQPKTFREFAEQAARYRQIQLPQQLDYPAFEKRGRERYQIVARQELVRELFRRPLELWLVLDQMMFLEENGYRCRWVAFCETELTPRNILVDAIRTPSPTGRGLG